MIIGEAINEFLYCGIVSTQLYKKRVEKIVVATLLCRYPYEKSIIFNMYPNVNIIDDVNFEMLILAISCSPIITFEGFLQLYAPYPLNDFLF